jgi:glycerate 2-kinase
VRVLAAPASLKGVLDAPAAAAAIAAGVRRAGLEAEEVPVADGGEGTAAVLAASLGGAWRELTVRGPLGEPTQARWLLLPDGTALVESAQAVGLGLVPESRLDPLRASSEGLGELIASALAERPRRLAVTLGGSATVDGGAGMRRVVGELPVPAVALCDVMSPLLGPRGAARAFGPQKGADAAAVEELERRLGSDPVLTPHAERPGAGAAGGLGTALAALGARLVPGASFVADAIGLRGRIDRAALVVTGEGRVDATTLEGKAPAWGAQACADAGVRCVLFGGVVDLVLDGVETHPLSGVPERAASDLAALGERLARSL